ncbi:MAG TPA: ATP-binding protein [Gemmatimonadaceae bacterium]|jgi:signal transduction histidine kinase|nr:ATP-binding protein [Gemmatimonadaceae bacterium]
MDLELCAGVNDSVEQRSGRDRRRQPRGEQDRLRAIVDRMADGIAIVGLEGTILFANPAAERLFGRPLSELSGSALGLPAFTGDAAEIEVVRPGDGVVAAELRVVDIEWDGAPARLISIRDVTDRKRSEERAAQLERERVARAEAEAASQAKSEFLAMMSHELRTPLNAVIGYSELLNLDISGPLNQAQRQQVGRIHASGRHLLGMVNEVLDLAKADARRLSLHHTIACAGDAADSALAIVQPLADERGVFLATECTGETDTMYRGDHDRVRQILTNLLNNAVKFTDAGGRVTVTCSATERPESDRLGKGKWVALRVEDTGIGIPASRLQSIFDPFVQAVGGHTRTRDGSGLGLTVSCRLARLMRGDITVKSEVGKGSTFTLWLPTARRPAASEAPRRTVEDAKWLPAATPRGRGLADVGRRIADDLDRLVMSYVERLRGDPTFSTSRSLRFSQLADHAATYVADIAGVLIAIDESRGSVSGIITDGMEIQRFVAERHGVQRARLKWTVGMLRREWAILMEEIEGAVRLGAPAPESASTAEALAIIRRFVDQGREVSCRALLRTLQDST